MRPVGAQVGFSDVLRGCRVLELSATLAGEQCAYALAGLGAEVLAVRSERPRLAGTAPPPPRPLDTSKRVVAIDAASEQGFEALASLAAQCDLLIEDRAPAGWGAGGPLARRLLARNPRLIAICIAPFGISGPRVGDAGHALNCYHAGGNAQQIPCNALRPGDRDRAPLQAGGQWGEAQAGTLAAVIALACLLDRERHAGMLIDCSKQEALISYNWIDVARFPNQGRSPTRLAPLATIVGGILPASDGFVEIAVREDRQWNALAELLGHPEWAQDPRFATRAARTSRWQEIAAMLAGQTRGFATQHLHLSGRERGIPIAAVMDLPALLADADLTARGAWASTAAGKADGAAPQVRLPRWDTSIAAPPATTGEAGAPPTTRGAPGLPLKGLRVLDLGWVAMGPYAGYLLACLGAQVIHVARPQPGGLAGADAAAYNYGFDTLNTGKTWVSIDLKHPDGAELLRTLAARCDIVLENFRPGVADRLGIGYAQLSKSNPRLVMVSASTYGRRNMAGAHVGYAPVFSALAGLANLTGHADGPPVEVSTPVDFYAGSVGVLGILAGLHRLCESGSGCHIDLAAREAVLWSLTNELAWLQEGHRDAVRQGNAHPDMAPHGVYRCRGENRWLSIAVGDDAEWRRLCGVMRMHELADDTRFVDTQSRIKHRAQLDRLLEQWTQDHDAGELCVRLQAAGVAACLSATSEDLWLDPHLQARGVFQSRQSAAGKRWYVAAPWLFADQPRQPLETISGPLAARAVFNDLLGLSQDKIDSYIRGGVVAIRQEGG